MLASQTRQTRAACPGTPAGGPTTSSCPHLPCIQGPYKKMTTPYRSSRRWVVVASVLPSSGLFFPDAPSCWSTFIYRTTGLHAVLGSSPACFIAGGTEFHKPFQGIIRAYIAHVGFGSLSVALLPLCDYIITQTVLFVKHFFYFFSFFVKRIQSSSRRRA